MVWSVECVEVKDVRSEGRHACTLRRSCTLRRRHKSPRYQHECSAGATRSSRGQIIECLAVPGGACHRSAELMSALVALHNIQDRSRYEKGFENTAVSNNNNNNHRM